MAERKTKSLSNTVVVNEIGRLMGMTPPQALDVFKILCAAVIRSYAPGARLYRRGFGIAAP